MSQGGIVSELGSGTTVVSTLTGNTGVATPAANNIDVPGAGSITTTGSGDTLTVELTGLTDHAVLVGAGTSTITKVGPVSSTGAVLMSNGVGSDPGFSTATYPLTTTAYNILSSSATNTVSEIANGTTGQVLTATTGAAPSWAAIGAVTSVSGTADFITSTGGTSPVIGVDTPFETTGMHGWNGSLLETASVTVASDGATITFSVEQSGGGDLTAVFSDGYYAWDTTPADTVALTAGTDTVPVQSYVYLLQSTKTLTASTVGWPSEEHAPLATIICQSAASLQTDGPYKMHAWTDHVTATDDQGHITDLNFWIRQQNATWVSGVGQTYTITPNGGAADNVTINTAVGVVLQLHDHTFPAFTAGHDYYVINDFATPYTVVTDLNALLTDSTGASMSGKYFSLVVWCVVSEDTGDCKIFVNLPGGSYNNSSGVTADANRYANFSIPEAYRGTGFLISQWNLRHQAAASGTWTSIDEINLRGLLPSITPGGTALSPQEFVDTAFRIFDDGDDTKKIAFQASPITTATTRTITMLDADIDLANVVQGPASATDNALARYDGTTGKLLQDSTVIVSDNGEMTNTSQPSFNTTLSTTQTNKTGNGATFTIVFDSVIYDQTSDYNNSTGIFTAPITGKYLLGTSSMLSQTTNGTDFNVFLVTSNKTYRRKVALTSGTITSIAMELIQETDLDIADTAYIYVQLNGIGADTADVTGASGLTTFYGHLIC